MKQYDALVIGSGQGGNPLAKKLAKAGRKTALIEKEHVGGSCINSGCTPTKAMIASAKQLYDCKRAHRLGVHTGEITVDLQEVVARKNEIVRDFREGTRKGLEETKNLELIHGFAYFTGEKTIGIDLNHGEKDEFSANHIFIDVGCRPAIAPIRGLEKIEYLTSTTILDITKVPEHLLIIGGSYIGLEFGQMFRRFGSKITIVDADSRFLAREDPDVAQCIRKILQDEGIDIFEQSEVSEILMSEGKPSAQIKTQKDSVTHSFSHLLLAAGRTPNTDLLQAEKAGIEVDDKGFITVNKNLETCVKGVYAIGDVKGGPEFTHISYNDHHVILKSLLEKEHVDYHDRLVPYTMFTDPQLGRVGMTEQEAREKGLHIRVATLAGDKIARGIEVGDTRGLMKAIVEADSGQILGAAILNAQGGEIMTVLQMAMVGKIKWQELAELPIAHPLYAESINNLFMQLR